ncbi:hypothetical protein F4779DRAFT_588545 [Xylariaceae sp. FL0662B]|nr:hypothetical protein F4779DRAFT_588545 [Xylariaceae sp. FL0662B]
MAQQVPSQQVRLFWPDNTVGPGYQSGLGNEECGSSIGCQRQECQRCAKKRSFIRPQVTINVLSSGGSSTGGSGSGSGGSGTGGAVTLAGDGAIGHMNSVSFLEAQLIDLSKKVEQLSRRAAPELMVETGEWSTMEVRPWQQTDQPTKGRVKFSRKFQSIPAVTTSISSVDASRNYNLRIKVYATDISSEGFTIHVDTWSDTKLYSCGVAWTAIGG